MAEEIKWFSKFEFLELVLAKNEADGNRSILEKVKFHSKLCEALTDEVSYS